MTSKFSQPVVCPVLIGREGALADLRRVAVKAVARGQVALISGEAGIGKTRLLGELLGESAAAGHPAWQVRFFEQDAELPYSAMDRLLNQLATSGAVPEQLLASLAADLRVIAPKVFSKVQADAPPVLEEDTDPGAEKRRVLEALRRLAQALCADKHVVLAFEDVHWADSSSLAAILTIARDANPGCLIVLTYRSDERSPALDSLLADLDHDRLASEVRLGRLGLTDVDRMLGAILGQKQATRADILHVINQFTGGNPFLVEEVVRSILDRAGSLEDLADLRLTDFDVPRSVNEALRRRTETLSSTAGSLLSLAAVAGIRLDLRLLIELSGLSEDELLVSIKELIAAQLVTEEADGAFAFRHALTREAIRSELLYRERQSLSLRIARALESIYAGSLDAHVEDLAWHLYQAGEWPSALAYATQAGERALALYSPAEALTHLTRAIDAGQHMDEARLAEVHRLRGSAYEAIGNFEAARADYERAAEQATDAGEVKIRWQSLIDLGLLWSARDYSRSEPYFRTALELARELGDPAALGHSLNRLGNWYSNIGDLESALPLSEEALAAFRNGGNDLGVAQTLDLLGMTCLQGMRFAQAVDYYREAIELLERLGDRRTLASALSSIQVCSSTYQTDILPPALSLAEASSFGERGLALSRDLGWKSAEAYALWQLAFCLGPQGEYRRALTYAQEAETISRDIGHTQWEIGALCALGAIYIDILATEEALACLRRAETLCQGMGSGGWAGQVDSLLIDATLAAHSIAGAEAFDPAPDLSPEGFSIRPLLTARANLALASGSTEQVFSILEQLDSLAVPGSGEISALRIARLRGRALAASGDFQAARDQLGAAEKAAQELGNASYRWRLNTDLAQLLLQSGDRDAARVAASKATELVDALAERIPDGPLRANFVARAMTHLPAVLRRRPAREHVAVLTAREAEIAALIAQGLTNRQIADRHVVSVRTVETHVANALAKLGFTARSQLAAWAVERGLLESEG